MGVPLSAVAGDSVAVCLGFGVKGGAVAGSMMIDDPHYTTPLYHKAEAAHIIAVPAQTFRDWAVGYARKRLDGSQVVSAPIVTTLEATRPQGVSVPFVGLAEA